MRVSSCTTLAKVCWLVSIAIAIGFWPNKIARVALQDLFRDLDCTHTNCLGATRPEGSFLAQRGDSNWCRIQLYTNVNTNRFFQTPYCYQHTFLDGGGLLAIAGAPSSRIASEEGSLLFLELPVPQTDWTSAIGSAACCDFKDLAAH